MPRRNDKTKRLPPAALDLSWLRPCTCGAKALGYTCRPDCAAVLAARAA